nr:beta-ketoacyl synthase N-terminal-like domain-containing protein [Escherichia coli]
MGYACHFPESPDGETFWQNLLEGRECSRRFTREELLAVVWMPPSLTILIMSISVRC